MATDITLLEDYLFSNGLGEAKLAEFSFVLFPNKYFFKLCSLTLLLPFLSDWLDDTQTIGPFVFKGAQTAGEHARH